MPAGRKETTGEDGKIGRRGTEEGRGQVTTVGSEEKLVKLLQLRANTFSWSPDGSRRTCDEFT